MFYSADILTGRKGELSVVWLAATLGPKSQAKKLTKKDYAGVDISKACTYLIEQPEALSLRLSSSLMVGMARVYGQQFSFYHSDVLLLHQRLNKSVFGTEEERARGEEITLKREKREKAASPATLSLIEDVGSDFLDIEVPLESPEAMRNRETFGSGSSGLRISANIDDLLEEEPGHRLSDILKEQSFREEVPRIKRVRHFRENVFDDRTILRKEELLLVDVVHRRRESLDQVRDCFSPGALLRIPCAEERAELIPAEIEEEVAFPEEVDEVTLSELHEVQHEDEVETPSLKSTQSHFCLEYSERLLSAGHRVVFSELIGGSVTKEKVALAFHTVLEGLCRGSILCGQAGSYAPIYVWKSS
ncbi:MAG: uncharacterized protein A8A55_0899 [Amphiamblys sp. WSBS2006]|nr:MAG: uncharacterized protein A8A55_0899 [Amphiamblys sp. WSBS2006]